MGIKKYIKQKLKIKLARILDLEIESPPYVIPTSKYVSVGYKTRHNGNIKIKGHNNYVEIGSYCAIGEDVTIITSNHNYNYPSIQYTFYAENFGETPYKNNVDKDPVVIIGNDVWIGDRVLILPGVKIGNGVCIGAGSIVTKDIPSFSIVAGIPAKVIKKRFSDKDVSLIEASEWWKYTEEQLEDNKEFFFKNFNN
jgi:acetyltransferase-like isoleucine patch superfamily enzyme